MTSSERQTVRGDKPTDGSVIERAERVRQSLSKAAQTPLRKTPALTVASDRARLSCHTQQQIAAGRLA